MLLKPYLKSLQVFVCPSVGEEPHFYGETEPYPDTSDSVGRYHTGLSESINSRYQYGAILCTMPFVSLWLSHICALLPNRAQLPRLAIIALVTGATWFVIRSWPDEIRPFCHGRGDENRRLLLVDRDPGPYAVTGIPFMPTERGKELIQKYHLH